MCLIPRAAIRCKLRATTQFDDQGQPCKAVGIVIDINDEKLAAQELKGKGGA